MPHCFPMAVVPCDITLSFHNSQARKRPTCPSLLLRDCCRMAQRYQRGGWVKEEGGDRMHWDGVFSPMLPSAIHCMCAFSVPDVSGSRESSPCTVTTRLRFSSIFLFNKCVTSPWNMVGRTLVWRRHGSHRACPAKRTGYQVKEGKEQLTVSSPLVQWWG